MARRRPWSVSFIMTIVLVAIARRRGPFLPVVFSTSTPSRTVHDRVWQGMVRNFGYRWEGRTYWHDPDAAVDSEQQQRGDGKTEAAVEKNGLRSIYQLEFPQEGRAGVGTWTGWNVFEEGDTRADPCHERPVSSARPVRVPFNFPRGVSEWQVAVPCPFPTTTTHRNN